MTRDRRKLPVDPLSNAAWKRIGEHVLAELESSDGAREPVNPAEHGPRRQWIAAVAALLAAASVAVALTFMLRQTGPVENASRVVTTGNVTRATVGDATLEVGSETEFVATGSEAGGWTVLVERGRVGFEVPERRDRPSFRVRAGGVLVEVVGTRFTVARAGDAVGVIVERGVVRVTSSGEARVLRDGEKWGDTSEVVGGLGIAAAPTSASSGAASATSPDWPMPGHPMSHSTEARPGVSTTSPHRAPSRRERFEAASSLEARDPGRAVELYLEMSTDSDAWAANALYAAGRVEFDRGRKTQARRLFQHYLRRFPKGQNAQEAQALLVRTE